MPEWIGFVFARKSRRFVTKEEAEVLKKTLKPDIKAVGVFVDEQIEIVAKIANQKIIDLIQLHGAENEEYIMKLRQQTSKPIIQAFLIQTGRDIEKAHNSSADFILLDAGKGTGSTFDWRLIKKINRPYFLAGGLDIENISDALEQLNPYAVDVSSGIETNGYKDQNKMKEFVRLVRAEKKK